MLTVSDLACARGGLPVLSGVSLRLEAGDVLVLRGPNGIGKTTLLRTVAGLQPPVSGRVEIAEGSVAYGGHSDGIKAQLSVAENLEFWAGIYGHTEGIALALAAFDLDPLRSHLGQNLSAGQKRRLGLARLLVTGRPVWALDEPTVSLDRDSVGLFVRALQTHRETGGAALIATHIDLGVAADEVDLTPFKATRRKDSAEFDEAFL